MKKKRLTRAQQDQILRILPRPGTPEAEPESLDAFFAAQITPNERDYCELEGISVVDFVRAKLAN